jgi:hypothetical protein
VKLPGLLAVVLLAGPVVAMADALEDKYQSLKDAVTSKDVAQVKKLTAELFPLVDAAICESAPEDADEKPAWASRVEHAKGIGLYGEYALFATAVASPTATLVDLVSTLEQQNPKSKYLDEAWGPYMVALSQTGASAKVPAIAEKALVNFPENEDLLLVLADSSVNRKQPDRALTYANRLVASLNKHAKPEGMPAAQWEHKRNTSLCRGYFIAGAIYSDRNQYVPADKNLRAALPLIQGNEPMMAATLFYLGMANYQLGKMTLSKARILEAAKFSQQSAAIQSAFTDQARHNALVMKAEADKMR